MSGPNQHPITVHLVCRDLPRSLRFYRDILGFSLKECWPDEQNPMFASLLLDGQALLLGAHCGPDELSKWCGDDQALLAWSKEFAAQYESNIAGAGVTVYLAVHDVDAYHTELKERGVERILPPTTQFYGQRDFPIQDPEGYRITFYTPVKMESCQSCGMPLTEAEPGQMYCGYCSEEDGKLKPYEIVLEGTIQSYFMGMKNMKRAEAEKAAKDHLANMPAWAGRG